MLCALAHEKSGTDLENSDSKVNNLRTVCTLKVIYRVDMNLESEGQVTYAV